MSHTHQSFQYLGVGLWVQAKLVSISSDAKCGMPLTSGVGLWGRTLAAANRRWYRSSSRASCSAQSSNRSGEDERSEPETDPEPELELLKWCLALVGGEVLHVLVDIWVRGSAGAGRHAAFVDILGFGTALGGQCGKAKEV